MIGNVSVSESRTYVVVCNNADFNGHYFRKFSLPTQDEVNNNTRLMAYCGKRLTITNNSEFAAWFFLNILNHYACIEGCIPFEDYQSIKDESVWYKEEK